MVHPPCPFLAGNRSGDEVIMTILASKNYHLRDALQERRILCVDPEDALREDIRALRIGILNIMPKAESYEFSLLHPLGRSVLQIEPVWIRLRTHRYISSDWEHLKNLYIPFEDAIKKGKGLLLNKCIKFASACWSNGVVPFTMKTVGYNIDFRPFFF